MATFINQLAQTGIDLGKYTLAIETINDER